jgi:hypothetical protein
MSPYGPEEPPLGLALGPGTERGGPSGPAGLAMGARIELECIALGDAG